MSLTRTTTLHGVKLNWTFARAEPNVDVYAILEKHLLKQSGSRQTTGSAVAYQIRVDNHCQADWLRWKDDSQTAPRKQIGGQSSAWNQVPSRFIDPARAGGSKHNAGKSVPPPNRNVAGAASQGLSTAAHNAGPSQQGTVPRQDRSSPLSVVRRQSSAECRTSLFYKYPQPPSLESHQRPWLGFNDNGQPSTPHRDSRTQFASWHPVSHRQYVLALICLLTS